MKLRKVSVLFIIISNSLLLFSQSNPVSIDLRNNSSKLDAKFYPANKTISPPTLILLHGFPGNASSPYGLAERLTRSGINVLVFNYEGSFNSEGIFSFENCMNDISVALAFRLARHNGTNGRIYYSNIPAIEDYESGICFY